MKEPAILSTSVLAVGHYLNNKKPSRSCYLTTVGGHFLGAISNFSAVSLFALLIQRGACADTIIMEQD